MWSFALESIDPMSLLLAIGLALGLDGSARHSDLVTGASGQRSVPRAVAPSSAVDPSIRCAARRATSVAIPFQEINLNALPLPPDDPEALTRGPRMLSVVTDSTTWPAVWRAAADPVAAPAIAFGNDVVLLLATGRYRVGPTDLRVTSIRQCRETGVVVITTLETRPRIAAIDMFDRALSVIRVTGRALAGNEVLFDQRLRFVP